MLFSPLLLQFGRALKTCRSQTPQRPEFCQKFHCMEAETDEDELTSAQQFLLCYLFERECFIEEWIQSFPVNLCFKFSLLIWH